MKKRSILNKVLLAASALAFAPLARVHVVSARRLNASDGTGDMLAAVGSASDMIAARYGMAACVVVFLLSWFLGRPRRPAA